jgi:hypothetical protein
MSNLQTPSIGRIVLYTYAAHDLDSLHQHLVGESRPAMIVRAFSQGHPSQQDPTIPCYNLHVFTDFANDGAMQSTGTYWATSRQLAAEPTPGKFHWPPRGEK